MNSSTPDTDGSAGWHNRLQRERPGHGSSRPHTRGSRPFSQEYRALQKVKIRRHRGSSSNVRLLLFHLLAASAIGLLYAAGFEYMTGKPDWLMEQTFTAAHQLTIGVFVALVPGVHPVAASLLPIPGTLVTGLGTIGLLLFVTLQLLFDALRGDIDTPARAHRLRSMRVSLFERVHAPSPLS